MDSFGIEAGTEASYEASRQLEKSTYDARASCGAEKSRPVSADHLVNMNQPLETRERLEAEESFRGSYAPSSAGEARLGCLGRTKQFFVDDYYLPRSAIMGNIMAGVVVGLAVVPEAIAFALVAGIPPQTGVDTTLITSIVVGLVGDRPGLCNGASGAIAVVIVELVRDFGVIYMGYTVIFAGVFCCVFAVLRMSNLIVFISASVMIGFVNGLAIIIGCAQFTGFKESPPAHSDASGRHLLSAFDVFVDGDPWVDPITAGWMMLEVVIVMCTMVGMSYIPWRWIKVIPSSLIGILLATAAEWGIVRPVGYQTRTVGDIGEMTGALPVPLWLRDYGDQGSLPSLNAETFGIILPYAGSLAAVALIEQLMTLELVNVMTKTVANAHRESFGLGVGNIVAGCFGGMGGNAMIGQSVIQVRSGGVHRISNLVVGLTVLIITVAAFRFVNIIPQAAFIGMMWMIVYYTFEWATFRLIWHAVAPLTHREQQGMFSKIKRVDVLVVVLVTIVTIFTNLAIAVAVGVGVNLLAFAWDSHCQVRLVAREDVVVPVREAAAEHENACRDTADAEEGGRVIRTYDIEGPLFFASARKFKALFDYDNDPDDVEIHCLNMQVMDYSALEAIGTVASDYAARGKRLHLRFLKEECHRQLAKGRGLLSDVASWRVVRVAEVQEVDIPAEVAEDHMEIIGEAKQKHYMHSGAEGLIQRRPISEASDSGPASSLRLDGRNSAEMPEI